MLNKFIFIIPVLLHTCLYSADEEKMKVSSYETIGGYTELDKEFSENFDKKLDEAFQKADNQDGTFSSDSDLETKTENKIKDELNGYLKDGLTNDTYDSNSFKDKINDTYLNVTKEESVNFVNEDDELTNEQKTEIINGINNQNSLESLTSFLDDLEVWVNGDDESGGHKWEGSDTMADNSENSQEANEQTNYSFDCECESVLEDAFENMYEHIITNNLSKIPANIEKLNEKLQAQIDETNNQTETIVLKKQAYILRLLEAKALLAEVKKQASMIKDKSIEK